MNRYRGNYIKISPSRARNLLKSDPYILLIDVRAPEEYAGRNIPGSINIPLQNIQYEISNSTLNPNAHIIVYCKSGMRAAQAASLLVQNGFQTVYTLGGIDDWPYETTRFTNYR